MLLTSIQATPLVSTVSTAENQEVRAVAAAEAPVAAAPARPSAPPAAGAAPPSSPASGTDAIVVTAGDRSKRVDPFESVNVQAFDAVQSVDQAVTGPVATKYKKSVPDPVRSGLRNFLSNLQEPVIFLNFLLQFKIGKAAETVGRFGINSTLGFVGTFDTAKKKPFHLPRRNNGFGYTLGYYGVKPGPFLYLPLIGPTTLRDLGGRLADLSVMPYAVGVPFSQPAYAIPTTTVRLLDERAEADEDIQMVRDGDEDPYTAIKKRYLRTRQAEIDALHGKGATVATQAQSGISGESE
jgi:phospholipid-binding lipoprotein MlaA